MIDTHPQQAATESIWFLPWFNVHVNDQKNNKKTSSTYK